MNSINNTPAVNEASAEGTYWTDFMGNKHPLNELPSYLSLLATQDKAPEEAGIEVKEMTEEQAMLTAIRINNIKHSDPAYSGLTDIGMLSNVTEGTPVVSEETMRKIMDNAENKAPEVIVTHRLDSDGTLKMRESQEAWQQSFKINKGLLDLPLLPTEGDFQVKVDYNHVPSHPRMIHIGETYMVEGEGPVLDVSMSEEERMAERLALLEVATPGVYPTGLFRVETNPVFRRKLLAAIHVYPRAKTDIRNKSTYIKARNKKRNTRKLRK